MAHMKGKPRHHNGRTYNDLPADWIRAGVRSSEGEEDGESGMERLYAVAYAHDPKIHGRRIGGVYEDCPHGIISVKYVTEDGLHAGYVSYRAVEHNDGLIPAAFSSKSDREFSSSIVAKVPLRQGSEPITDDDIRALNYLHK